MPKKNGTAQLDEQFELRSAVAAFFKSHLNAMQVFET